ncbi:MAG: hypothetical protein WBM32_12540 [Crocosphaera sp.]
MILIKDTTISQGKQSLLLQDSHGFTIDFFQLKFDKVLYLVYDKSEELEI